MPTIEHRPAPIQDAFDMFLLECEARRFTQATQIHYKSRVVAFVAFCSAEQAKKVIAACRSDRKHAIVLFLLDTGVKAAELCSLNGGDINTKSGAVMVRQGKGQKDCQVYLGTKACKQRLCALLMVISIMRAPLPCAVWR